MRVVERESVTVMVADFWIRPVAVVLATRRFVVPDTVTESSAVLMVAVYGVKPPLNDTSLAPGAATSKTRDGGVALSEAIAGTEELFCAVRPPIEAITVTNTGSVTCVIKYGGNWAMPVESKSTVFESVVGAPVGVLKDALNEIFSPVGSFPDGGVYVAVPVTK